MAASVLADTSALLAVLDASQRGHERCAAVFTLDNNDFETYRIGARKKFRILPGR